MKRCHQPLCMLLSVALLASCGRHEAPETPRSPSPGAEAIPVSPSAYQVPTPALPQGGFCALDAIAGNPAAGAVVAAGTTVRFAGWAADAHKRNPGKLTLVLSGATSAFSYVLHTGSFRPDVAKALGSPALAASGYNMDLSFSDMPAGEYRAAMVVHGDATTVCDLSVQLRVE